MKMETKGQRAKKRALKAFISKIWDRIYESAETGLFEVSVIVPKSLAEYFIKKMGEEGFSIAWQYEREDLIQYKISWS
jgi:hypothetical protein